jgi:hypothetical protein
MKILSDQELGEIIDQAQRAWQSGLAMGGELAVQTIRAMSVHESNLHVRHIMVQTADALELGLKDAVERTREKDPGAFRDLLALMGKVADWGDRQFPGSTWEGKGKHLVKEAREALESPGNGEELADVLMILCHMIRQAGVDIYAEVERKLAICEQRQWQAPDADGVVEHVRDTPTVEPWDAGVQRAATAQQQWVKDTGAELAVEGDY